jgi:hypothetical protein
MSRFYQLSARPHKYIAVNLLSIRTRGADERFLLQYDKDLAYVRAAEVFSS